MALVAGCTTQTEPTIETNPSLGLAGESVATASGVLATSASTTVGLVGRVTAQLHLLSCPAEPSQTASAAIGPEGGTLKVGRHTLTVPSGALGRRVTITGRTSGDRTASVLFSPDGLRFAKKATLRLDYRNCNAVPGPKLVVYTTDDARSILEILPSLDLGDNRVVDGRLDHFSRYAVAW